MTQQLTDMEIDRVDLVDAGANGRRFALFKRDPAAAVLDGADEGFLAKVTTAVSQGLAKAFGIPELVEKTMTFAQIVAGREISVALEENWWVLQDSLWNAIYATDDEGDDLTLDAKKALVAQNLDEFKAFLLERMDAGVEKSARPTPARFVEALVAKVGGSTSDATAAQLTQAAEALTAVLAEVESDGASDTARKRATAAEETNDMTPEELSAAIAKGNEPLVARIEALEKATPVAKTDDAEEEVTLAVVAEAVTKLADRVGEIEKGRGTRQSAAADEAATPVKKSKWAGVLG